MKYENLRILSELRDKGRISEEEYQREKAKILNDDEQQTYSSNSSFSFDKPLFGITQKTFLMIMHLSQLAIFLAPLVGIIIPIVLWALQKDNNPLVDKQGKDIINYNLSFLIYAAICAISIVGIPLLVVVAIVYLVFVVKAAIDSNSGKPYVSYPLTIKFIK